MMDFKELKCRFDVAKNFKGRWLALYQDLYRYVLPDRNAFNELFNFIDEGRPLTSQIWDSTAMLGAYQRANDLHALLLPQDRVWGKYALDPKKYQEEDIERLQPILDEINENILGHLNESNLSRVISGSNLDLVGGTGAVLIESISDDIPLQFTSIPAVTLFIEQTQDDVLTTCWYSVKKLGRYILQEYPDYQGKCRQKLESAKDDQFIVTYGQIKLKDNKFYLYCVLSDDDPYYPLWETEREYNQIIIYRDRIRPGEAEGRGIALDLMPSIIDLNRLVKDNRKSQAFKANPPVFYNDDNYFNPYSVRQWAGAWIARRPNGRNPVEAMQMPVYPDVLEEIRDLREIIRRGFQIDPLGEIETPAKTATEISIRENRAQRSATMDISRLVNEQPRQIFNVAAKILAERRLLSRERDVYGIKTSKFKFDFQSPLYDLQKQDDLAHFVTNLQVKQQFFGQGSAMATVNLPEANKFLTDKLNLPSKLFVSSDVLSRYIQQAAQLQQQQMQAQMPQPSTTAGQVQFPQQSQVQI